MESIENPEGTALLVNTVPLTTYLTTHHPNWKNMSYEELEKLLNTLKIIRYPNGSPISTEDSVYLVQIGDGQHLRVEDADFSAKDALTALIVSPIPPVPFEEPQPLYGRPHSGSMEEDIDRVIEARGEIPSTLQRGISLEYGTTEEQSEPLTDFLDRYVPDWRKEPTDNIWEELDDLKEQFDYDIFDAVHTEKPALEGYSRGFIIDSADDFIVRYFPPGTAAFADSDNSVQTITEAGISFTKMVPNEDSVDALLSASKRWEADAKRISESTDTARIALRAQFAADVAFHAAKTLQANKCCVVVAFRQEPVEIVGVSIYQIYKDKTALIQLVTVAPQYQPGVPGPKIRGIGTGMLCWIADDLIKAQVHQVCLKPLDDEAEKFWRNRGFTDLGNRNKLCVIDGVERLLVACQVFECPDQGEHCTIGDEDLVAAYRKPSAETRLAHFQINTDTEYNYWDENIENLSKQINARWYGFRIENAGDAFRETKKAPYTDRTYIIEKADKIFRASSEAEFHSPDYPVNEQDQELADMVSKLSDNMSINTDLEANTKEMLDAVIDRDTELMEKTSSFILSNIDDLIDNHNDYYRK